MFSTLVAYLAASVCEDTISGHYLPRQVPTSGCVLVTACYLINLHHREETSHAPEEFYGGAVCINHPTDGSATFTDSTFVCCSLYSDTKWDGGGAVGAIIPSVTLSRCCGSGCLCGQGHFLFVQDALVSGTEVTLVRCNSQPAYRSGMGAIYAMYNCHADCSFDDINATDCHAPDSGRASATLVPPRSSANVRPPQHRVFELRRAEQSSAQLGPAERLQHFRGWECVSRERRAEDVCGSAGESYRAVCSEPVGSTTIFMS
jgi:hypothetical protein